MYDCIDIGHCENYLEAKKKCAEWIASRKNIKPLYVYEMITEPDGQDFSEENCPSFNCWINKKCVTFIYIGDWFLQCHSCNHYAESNNFCHKYHKKVNNNDPCCISYKWHPGYFSISDDNPWKE